MGHQCLHSLQSWCAGIGGQHRLGLEPMAPSSFCRVVCSGLITLHVLVCYHLGWTRFRIQAFWQLNKSGADAYISAACNLNSCGPKSTSYVSCCVYLVLNGKHTDAAANTALCAANCRSLVTSISNMLPSFSYMCSSWFKDSLIRKSNQRCSLHVLSHCSIYKESISSLSPIAWLLAVKHPTSHPVKFWTCGLYQADACADDGCQAFEGITSWVQSKQGTVGHLQRWIWKKFSASCVATL